jgi:hypothetical protein
MPQKFIQKLQTMATAMAALKSPSVPLFKGGSLSQPLFGKEGAGEIFGRNEAEIMSANLWGGC